VHAEAGEPWQVDGAEARVTDSGKPKAAKFSWVADGAGVLGASFAALCCAGTPFVLVGLAALGVGFLKRDGILWPLMIASLMVALWGFWRGRQIHGRVGPFVIGLLSATVLTAGVIFVHGFPAMQMIWTAIAGLIVATAWNLFARLRLDTQAQRGR
jgi:mercuric ion transport protein